MRRRFCRVSRQVGRLHATLGPEVRTLLVTRAPPWLNGIPSINNLLYSLTYFKSCQNRTHYHLYYFGMKNYILLLIKPYLPWWFFSLKPGKLWWFSKSLLTYRKLILYVTLPIATTINVIFILIAVWVWRRRDSGSRGPGTGWRPSVSASGCTSSGLCFTVFYVSAYSSSGRTVSVALRSVYTQHERVQREHEHERDFWAVLPFK